MIFPLNLLRVLSGSNNPSIFFISLLSLLITYPCFGDNIGSISNPTVKKGEVSTGYKLGVFEKNGDTTFVHRGSIKFSIRDDISLQFSQEYRSEDSALNHRFSQIRTQWQFAHQDKPSLLSLDAALRFDYRDFENESPSALRMGFSTSHQFENKLKLIGLVAGSQDIGNGARQGIALQTRLGLFYPLNEHYKGGIELYNRYNRTSAVGSFADQKHHLGFSLATKFKGLSIYSGVLFGLTDNSSDRDFRLFLKYPF